MRSGYVRYVPVISADVPCTYYVQVSGMKMKMKMEVHYSDVSTIQIPTVHQIPTVRSPLHVPKYHFALHNFRPSFNRPLI